MPIVDQLFLNPFEKWSRYGRFPYSFLLHIVLLGLVTMQALVLFARDTEHVSRTVRHFNHLFVGATMDETVTFHERATLEEAFRNAVRNHFFINNASVVHFELVNPTVLSLRVRWRDNGLDHIKIESSGFSKANATIDEELQAYLTKTVPFLYDNSVLPKVGLMSLEHSFREIGYVTPQLVGCQYNWRIITLFDGRQAGEFRGTVDSRASDCRGKTWGLMHIVHLICLLLAVLGLILVGRRFERSLRLVATLRRAEDHWAVLTWGDLLGLFSGWWVTAAAMHTVQLASCIVCLHSIPDVGIRFQWVGFSCFLTWLTMCQYLESFPGYYMAFHTLGISAGRVCRFLCSVMPLFVGFVLLGVCLFWRAKAFESPGAAAASLFSLMNGDMIHDTFESVYGIGGLIAHVFLYVFLLLFIFVILNVNISIVTDAYERAKKHPQRESAKQIKQQIREAAAERRTSPTPSPPDSPRLGRMGTEGSRPPSQRSGLGQELMRRPSRPLIGYMSPRFFNSDRIQRALAATFPEEDFINRDGEVGGSSSITLATSASVISAEALAGQPPSGSPPQEAGETLEMAAVARSWEDFDRLAGRLQETVMELRGLALPPCQSDEARQQLIAHLQALDRSTQFVVEAHRRADEAVRQQRAAAAPPVWSFSPMQANPTVQPPSA